MSHQARRQTRLGLWCLLLGLLFLASGAARAQTIESLQWVDAVQPATLRIEFNANVRFLRQSPTTPSDFSQLSFQIVAADEQVLGQTVEEGKRLEARDGLPSVALNYVPMPTTRMRLLTLRFGSKVQVRAHQGPGAKTIDVSLVSPGSPQAVESLPAPAATPAERRYVVLLRTLNGPEGAAAPRVPAEFQDFAVFTSPVQLAGVRREALVMGYFSTEQDAQLVQRRLRDRFADAAVLPLADLISPAPASTDAPAAQVVPVAPAAPASAPAEPAAESGPSAAEQVASVERQAEALLGQAQVALGQQRFKDAADLLNRALMLPPNASSQLTQELIGAAWEGLGEVSKARLEYQLYLKLYPEGDGATRVAGRLAELTSVTGTQGRPAAATAQLKPGAKTGLDYSGSISQYYYGGNSKTQSLVNISAGIDQNTLSRTSQSALVTSVDLSGRYKSEGSETRLVLRETASKNFIASSKAQSVLSAAYVDYKDLETRLAVRLGRQSAIGGSLFGLFDGASLTVPLGTQFKLDAMAGAPANALVTAPSQRLLGVMLEADSLFDHWGGNLSLVEQKTEGISDRRSLGAEVRYFGEGVSVYSQVDYEMNFRQLNAVTLQGSMQGPLDTTITMLVDNRKAPTLQLSDALISGGTTSLRTLLQLKTLAEVQDMARATAAQARQSLISVSRSMSPKWQASADIRFSEVGALPAVGNFEAMPATGAQYNFSLQLTGSNLYSSRDINGFNVSVLSSATAHGLQLAYNNLTGFHDNKATFEPSIRFYTQTDNTSTKVVRVSPGLRLSYKVSEKASLLGETIYERSKTDGLTNHDASSSVFFYVGYRYDLF